MFVALNETFLDDSTEKITLIGYDVIARRDRDCHGGGIALFGKTSVYDIISHLENEASYERLWCTIYTHLGPILLGIWYRPPYNEISSILECQVFLDKYLSILVY